MKFSLTSEVPYDLFKRFQGLNDLSNHIAKQFQEKDYPNLKSCLINLHCFNPKNAPQANEFHTGHVLDRKYIASKKSLVYTAKIKYEDIENTDDLKPSIIKALRGSVNSINELAIPNFDMSVLVNDVVELLESGDEITSSNELENVPVIFTPEEKKTISQNDLMPEVDFWKLVDESQNEALFNDQITFLINQLASLSVEQLYSFELRLRTLLQKSNHYNVLALAKVMLGTVSDDSFLYFQCRIILLGKQDFEKAIKNPDSWNSFIDDRLRGEELLSVSDRAFYASQGKKSHDETPRDYAMEYLDYDDGSFEVLGEEWREKELPLKYPNLWKQYSNLN